MIEHKPTEEQTYVLDLVRTTSSNLMIRALAGTGKSTTLEMIEAAAPTKPILDLAFSKKVAENAKKKMASTTMVKTFNSLGHGIWAKAIGKQFKPDARKTGEIFRGMISEATKPSAMWDAYSLVCDAVGMAKSIGYIPPKHSMSGRAIATWSDVAHLLDEEVPDAAKAWIDTVLIRSIALAYQGTCDFDDQIYMPTLFAGQFPEFPLVMIDEYQDLNPVNHEMIRKLTKHRIIGVGDPHQSIFAFRGAVPSGMDNGVARFSMTECDLSISFRCPEAIVRNVHWRVPKFRWSKPGGIVCDLSHLDLSDLSGNPTFICRNNAPLFSLAMRMLSAGHSVNVSGSDIGPKIIRIMKKLGPESLATAGVLEAIDRWLAEREAKGSTTAKDTAECMKTFARYGTNLIQAMTYAEHLFRQEGQISFMTGHKAKGLEFPIVFHLDPFLLGHSEQEKNLAYVIGTRSSDQLYTVNSETIQ